MSLYRERGFRSAQPRPWLYPALDAVRVDRRCERCGAAEEWVEVSDLTSAEPEFILARSCPCPGPRCPCCHVRLDDHRKCASLDCPIAGCIVPVPDIA